MSSYRHHPEPELLDQLRAGLLDEKPAQKAELESHIQHCEACRQLYDWPAALRPEAPQVGALSRQLDQARQQALAVPDKSLLRRFVPVAAAAAIALVAVILVNPLQQPDSDDTQLAGTGRTDTPEVFEDLDFYLWLADHKDTEDSST